MQLPIMIILTLSASLAVITVAYGVVTFNAYTDDEKDAHDIFRILMRPRTPERYMPRSYFHKHVSSFYHAYGHCTIFHAQMKF